MGFKTPIYGYCDMTLLGVIVILASIKSRFLTYLVLLALILVKIDFSAGSLFLFGILAFQLFNKLIRLLQKSKLKLSLI